MRVKQGRFWCWFCDSHGAKYKQIQPVQFEEQTTGSKECDKQINRAIDMALLRIAPILRDFIREEIKRNLEACDDDTISTA